MLEKEVASMIEILKKELQYYKDLLALSNTKKTSIIEGKVAELDKIVKLEQNMIFDLGQLEKQREEEVNKLCQRLGISDRKASLTEITEKLTKEDRTALERIQAAMRKTLSELKAQNDLNGELIKQSLEYIDFSINILTSSGMETGSLYGDVGSNEKSRAAKTRLFDTKI